MTYSFSIRFAVKYYHDTAIAYPEFPFENEANGDCHIGVHQARTVKNLKEAYNFSSYVAWTLNDFKLEKMTRVETIGNASNLCNLR